MKKIYMETLESEARTLFVIALVVRFHLAGSEIGKQVTAVVSKR